MPRDPLTGEMFLRVVGHRARPPMGEVPSAEAHALLLQQLQEMLSETGGPLTADERRVADDALGARRKGKRRSG